ncbi:MAG: FUSC family protein [Achromobacter xylosoxidans]|nr:FUSC family protein [Achromobacter xylosoxidans]
MHSGDMRHVRILGNLFKRASRSRLLLGRDGVRLPLQTVGAVLLAYAWMTWQRMPDVAWGAFSALFVVRATIEGTVTEAIARIVGAMAGVALGVGVVLLAAAMNLSIAWSIVASVGAAAFMSIRWPWLGYSLVTATILTVAPDDDILAGAASKTLAICVGSASGILAAFTVLPLRARASMRYNMAASLESYGELLVDWAAALGQGRPRPREQDKPALARARWRAASMACQARPLRLRYPRGDREADWLHERIEQLWLTVPLLERVGRLTLTDNVCNLLGASLDEVARAARRQIDALARAIREKNARGLACPAAQPLARLAQAIEHGAFSPAERETAMLVAWTWREVTHELDAVCQGLEARRHGAPSSPIQHRG